MIQEFLSSDLVWRLGWTLLHSIWQLLLIWVFVAGLLSLLARQAANTRYLVACIGMAAMYLPLAVTIMVVPPRLATQAGTVPIASAGDLRTSPVELPVIEPAPRFGSVSDGVSPTKSEPIAIPSTSLRSLQSTLQLANAISPWLPSIVGTWLAGVVLFAVWNVGGWVVIQRLTRYATVPASQGVHQRLHHVARQLRISRPVELVESMLVETPTVIGWLRPMILLPLNLVSSLTAMELDAVLAHELAHVGRHDYLVNLLQAFTETVLFYHPGVWLISRRIRIEREYCCDDAAIAACGSKTEYARALATIEHGRALPAPAMSFFGSNTKRTLDRIRRILGRSPSTRHARLAGGAWLAALVMTAIAGGLLIQAGLVAASGDSKSQAQRADIQSESRRDEKESDHHEARRGTMDIESKESLQLFRIVLTHHGETDKPFYNLTLSVPPLSIQKSPDNLFVPIDEDQAASIVKWLSASQFFQHARVTETLNDPTGQSSQYLLRVRFGDKHYEETLGWDPGTIARLDGLRKALNGAAAQSMDVLLGRLASQRIAWESGEAVNGLTTVLSTRIARETNTFMSGRPIPVEVHIKNVSSEERQYVQPALHGSDFVVTNEHGRRVPLLGGHVSRRVSPTTIKPGETRLIGTTDLAIDYYLRRAGRYSVSFRGYGMPPSNSFRLTVESHAAGNADGDPVGRLLSLESAKWSLLGNTNLSATCRPGSNRIEVPGWQFQFFDRAEGLKMSKAVVWIWLTEEAAEEVEPLVNDYRPVSESLGKVSRWNVYLYVSPEALKVWPTVKEDLKTALENTPRPTGAESVDSAVGDDDYRALHDHYKGLILGPAKAGDMVEIARLSDEFNASIDGKLLFAQVISRTGPTADHKTVFSKFFDPQRKISPGKLHLAASDKPIVTRDLHREGCVMIATTPLANNLWPDDLQITLLMDPAEADVLRKAR